MRYYKNSLKLLICILKLKNTLNKHTSIWKQMFMRLILKYGLKHLIVLKDELELKSTGR